MCSRFVSSYRYVVVAEFHDDSENWIGLMEDIRREQPECRLFVLNDDLLSIFRFTDSVVGIITRLPERVGATERVDRACSRTSPAGVAGRRLLLPGFLSTCKS